MKELTARQKEVLDFIIDFKSKNENSPSLREIADGVNLKNVKSAVDNVAVLVKKGYITRTEKMSRSIRVVKTV